MIEFVIRWHKTDEGYQRMTLCKGNDAIHVARKWAQWIYSSHGDTAMVVNVLDLNTGAECHVRVSGLSVEPMEVE